MARAYYIAGIRFHRRSNIRLSAEERRVLERSGQVTLLCPLEWPLPDRIPHLDRAYIDPGGTDIWGRGPYLKVPNYATYHEEQMVNRVFCPWGYPPDRLRIAHHSRYVQLVAVELLCSEAGQWQWQLTLAPWLAPRHGTAAAP